MKKTPRASKRISNQCVSTFRLPFYPSKTGISRICSAFLVFALLLQMLISGPIRAAKASDRMPLTAKATSPPNQFHIQNPLSDVAEPLPLTTTLLSELPDLFNWPTASEDSAENNTLTSVNSLAVGGASLFSMLDPEPKTTKLLEPKENETEPKENETEPKEIAANPNTVASSMMTAAGSIQFDFDGDGKADIGRWHPSTHEFKVRRSTDKTYLSTLGLGSGASKPVPGDFNGDNWTDMAVYNPGTTSTTGTWSYLPSQVTNPTPQTLSLTGVTGDSSGDIPIAGDFDHDGTTDVGVFRPSNGNWYIRQSNSGATVNLGQWGTAGDIPITGDYDRDGVTDIAVYRLEATNATPPYEYHSHWYFHLSSGQDSDYWWGQAGDIPVEGDFDGNGSSDPAVYRPSEGIWYVATGDGFTWSPSTPVGWGNYGDQPVPADYDGDGKTDYAVWRPKSGVWFILKSLIANPSKPEYIYATLGNPGDTAIPSSYIKQIGVSITGYDMANARLAPANATGGTNLYSQNFSWGTSLVGLSGRAGLNAGFGISYNSLVWLKHDSTMYFDPDFSNVSPGFRLGFPVIEPLYYDKKKDLWAYMMVTPDGARKEFRQIAASNQYEAADSSYTQLVTTGATSPNDPVENITIKVTSTDGTQMFYDWKGGAFRCNFILDRNGNYIQINHTDSGLLGTVTDTLGRVISIAYDPDLYPVGIYQTWKNNNGSGSLNVTHPWAGFTYTTVTVNTNFGSLAVSGPPNSANLKVLEKITYPDGSYTKFLYNSYAQVKQIESYAADGHKLNHVRTDLDSVTGVQSDCPRFTETDTYAENFNGGQVVRVENSIPYESSFSGAHINEPNTTVVDVRTVGNTEYLHTKLHFAKYDESAKWKEGLPIATEDCTGEDYPACNNRQRWTWTNWEQDQVGMTPYSYLVNPRVIETQVGDNSNTRRSTMSYIQASSQQCSTITGEGGEETETGTNVACYGLVDETNVYDASLETVIKKSVTKYNLGSGLGTPQNPTYKSLRIIGLPSQVEIWGRNDSTQTLDYVSKVTYGYDEGGYTGSDQLVVPGVGHHNTNYGSGFSLRGNLTSTTRWNAEHPTNSSLAISSHVKYNTAGSPISQTDPANRTVRISYVDTFNSSGNPATYAYPTRITDPAGSGFGDLAHTSIIKYRYDIGANVESISPAPTGNTDGKTTKRMFDSLGRLERDSVYVGNSEKTYMRYEYPTNGIQSRVYSTIVDTNNSGGPDTADEVLSESWANGAGLVYKARTPHSFNGGATSTWAATLTNYDILGRVTGQSIPTEVNSSWIPVNDDDRGTDPQTGNPIWLGNSSEYDWKGRVTRTINSEGNDQLFSYDGCGCAGGQITTVQGPLVPRDDLPSFTARRTQRTYADILGRNNRTELLNWDGIVYKTVNSIYNGADQPVSVIESDANNTESREATTEYDGFGRVKRTHQPGQDAGKFTTYAYTIDSKPQSITDARGAIKHFDYNGMGQVESIEYESPAAVPISYTEPTMTHASGNADGVPFKLLLKGLNIANNAVIKATVSVMNGPTYFLENIERSTVNGEEILKVDLSDNSPNNSSLKNHMVAHPYRDVAVTIINPPVNSQPSKKTKSASMFYANGTLTVHAPIYVPDYSVSTTPPVSFIYDNLGNRTQMTDGSGTVSYEYNSLGQMKAETRTFSETPPLTPIPNSNAFRIEYTYGLSGQLASYKEPFGEIVSYTHDKAGRMKTVTGNRTVENVQLNYVTDAKYRAWGAAKQVDFIGGRTEINGFNNGLQVNDYLFSYTQNGVNLSTHMEYGYFDDGRIKSSKYLANPNMGGAGNYLAKFDRSYEYDFLGRLTAAKTGAEAHGTPEPNAQNRPYRMTLAYNTFDDITNQDREHYVSTFNSAFQYQNARNVHEDASRLIPGWDEQPNISKDSLFDADGRPLGDIGALTTTFDVAGNRTSIHDFDEETAQGNISVKYDGDGEKIETDKPYYTFCSGNSGPQCLYWRPHIYILSSVLGQEVGDFGERSDGGGMERDSRIIANGRRIAERRLKRVGQGANAQEATFLQRGDPSGVEIIDQIVHYTNWDSVTWGDGAGTVDPFGAGVGYYNPYPPERIDPPSPDECQSGECECDPGDPGDEPPSWECETEFDDQEDEETETGSVSEGTCYDDDGNKIDCKEEEGDDECSAYGCQDEEDEEGQDERDSGKIVRTLIDFNGDLMTITSTWVDDLGDACQNGHCPDVVSNSGHLEHNTTTEPGPRNRRGGPYDGGESAEPVEPPSTTVDADACAQMVRILQELVDDNLKSLGGPSKMTNHTTLNQLVSNVDTGFGGVYLKNETPSSLRVEVPARFYGEEDFQDQYQEGDRVLPNGGTERNDQTHHFARYFRAGIRGQSTRKWAHETFLENQNADLLLGDAAYSFGKSLNAIQTGTNRETIDLDRRGHRYKETPIYESASTRLQRILGIAAAVKSAICK